MKRRPINFSLVYKKALRAHLELGRRGNIKSAEGLGKKALAAGLSTLDLAKLHENTLIKDLLPSCPAPKRTALIKRASVFFAAAIIPEVPKELKSEAARLKNVIESLSDRTVELATANQLLNLEIVHRKQVESSLKTSESHHLKLLEKSDLLKEQLRGLSRKILTSQEDERKKISRELHDVIAQELMGINVRLATLKTASGINSKGLERNIAITQKMVTKSAKIVHQFARKLRPTSLDDLGLIPSLHSFMKDFTESTGVRSHLTAFADVEKLNSARRTALYRVTQEALTNVALHARASRVNVIIRKDGDYVILEVSDDGKSFDIATALLGQGSKHLGLLGMRERVEMIGGFFQIKSPRGKGVIISAKIPTTSASIKKLRLEIQKSERNIS